jgi:cell division protein ZapA
MKDKKYVKVCIDGKKFELGGMENEEYLKRVSEYVNRRIEEIKKADGFKRLSRDYQLLTIYLNLADDYLKLLQGNNTGKRIEELEDQIRHLTYELVDLGLEKENMEKEKNTLSFELDKSHSILSELEKEKEILEQGQEALKERIKAFDSKFREIEKVLEQKEEEEEEYKRKLSESEDEQLRLMEENEELRKELERYQASNCTA